MNRLMMGAAVGLLVGLAGQCFAVTLQYNLAKGDVDKYRILMAGRFKVENMGQGQDGETKGEIQFVQRVEDVSSDGILTLSVQATKVKINVAFGGTEQAHPFAIPPMTLKMNRAGKVLEVKGSNPTSPNLSQLGGFDFGNLIAGMEAFGFPEKDLQAGESWKNEIKLGTGANKPPLVIRAMSKLIGLEDIEGAHCARIKTTFDVPVSQIISQMLGGLALRGTQSGETEVFFDYEKGRVVKGSGSLDLALTMDSPLAGGEALGEDADDTSAMTVKVKLNFNIGLM